MLSTVNSLIETHSVTRKVAVVAYRYMRGIDSLADVSMTLVRRNPITGGDETSMTEWLQFCKLIECEGCNPPNGYALPRQIEKDGRKFVFAS